MRIAILSRNRNLYSTRRLLEAGIMAGHDVRVVDHVRCFMDITSEKPTIHYRGRIWTARFRRSHSPDWFIGDFLRLRCGAAVRNDGGLLRQRVGCHHPRKRQIALVAVAVTARCGHSCYFHGQFPR